MQQRYEEAYVYGFHKQMKRWVCSKATTVRGTKCDVSCHARFMGRFKIYMMEVIMLRSNVPIDSSMETGRDEQGYDSH
jgi:hypothetical protein